MRPADRPKGAIVALGVLILLAFVAPSTIAAGVPLPDTMASTGDSLTRAAGTGFLPWTDNVAASWSTGRDTRVRSHYLRLLALTPAIRGRNYNDARSGARMGELASQMDKAVSQRADYVTVEMGGNDVCASTEGAMTPVTTYRAQFRAAMDRFRMGRPRARVFVASIPNIHHLWELYHDDLFARFAWAVFGVCQSMLAHPTSTAQADVDRRARVLQRIRDYNAALAAVCTSYRRCRFDGYTVFKADFTKADVLHTDYFHPSISGQAKFAAGTWAVGYWGPLEPASPFG